MTILLSALDAVSVQQAIALALPALVLTIGGLIISLVPDAWTAWRRGFKQGCRVALMLQRENLDAGTSSAFAGHRNPYPGNTEMTPQAPVPLGRHDLPPAAL